MSRRYYESDGDPIDGAWHALKIMLIAGLQAMLICNGCGCVSMQGGAPAEVKATPESVQIGFNPLVAGQEIWNWIKDSPGKILFGAFVGYVGRDYARSKGL
jgi:hypothetical protein